MISSVIGVPLGVLCGTYALFSRVHRTVRRFFVICRHRPSARSRLRSSAFMTGRKITIIVIGTLFQQILIISQPHAQTPPRSGRGGADARHQESSGAVARRHPRILPDLYRDPAHLLAGPGPI